MFFGYNTNGMAHHDPADAIGLLAESGYDAVALTIDHGLLSPCDPHYANQLHEIEKLLELHEMRSVIETGARYLLDSRVKHEPTLLSANQEPRFAFYRHAIDCAAALGSDCVSIWSGVARDGADHATIERRLVDGLCRTLEYADSKSVTLAFEPEPGMWIETCAQWWHFVQKHDLDALQLTIDVGHLHCMDEPIVETISKFADRLVNIHLEDMRKGEHEHLKLGQGEIDFPSVFAAIQEAAYRGGVYVELSRHSHEAPSALQQSMRSICEYLDQADE